MQLRDAIKQFGYIMIKYYLILFDVTSFEIK
jgi:hypothetical protein